MADSPMGWVRSTTLSKEEETEAHWTCCNPDKFAELALMLFTSLIHLLPLRLSSASASSTMDMSLWEWKGLEYRILKVKRWQSFDKS